MKEIAYWFHFTTEKTRIKIPINQYYLSVRVITGYFLWMGNNPWNIPVIWQKSLFKHESFNSSFKVGSELSLFYHGILTLSGNLFHNCISLLYQKPCLIAPDKCQTILPSLEIWQMYVKGQLSYFLDAHVWIFFHNSSFRNCIQF